MGVNNAFDPKQNLDGGVRYLHTLLERYNGDLDRALAAYNAGPGAVDRAGGIPRYRETREYVQKVTDSYFRPGSDRLPQAFNAAASHLPRGGCRRTGRFYERMRQTLRHKAAKIRPILRVFFASLLVLSLFPLASRADENTPARRDAAKAQFERAEKARQALEARPENARTLKDYTALVIEYQRVYLITPHAAGCSRVAQSSRRAVSARWAICST